MAFDISNKFVIGVASSALFDLSESDQIWKIKKEVEYRKYQEQLIDVPFNTGVAYPFIRRFLNINKAFPEQNPVEVVLLSRNSPETGLRVMRSIQHYGLNITRAAFMKGRSPYEYLPAFNASLFLTANEDDVKKAIEANYPAGLVLLNKIYDDEADNELRVAFDFDGVLADDEAERIYRTHKLEGFTAHELEKIDIPHNPGLLADLFQKLSSMQKLERRLIREDPHYQPILRTAIITARSAPAHERVVTTLKNWGVTPDETFFLGGMEKHRILSIFRPHLFFDDQLNHLKSPAGDIPMVHIPIRIEDNTLQS